MRCLTLHQPWATLVAVGVKRHETRSWSTRYRGPLAIHAALLPPADGRIGKYTVSNGSLWSSYVTAWGADDPRCAPLPLGAVVATCTLADCQPTEKFFVDETLLPYGDFSPGRFIWTLHDVEPVVPPQPARGRQGLWEWTP